MGLMVALFSADETVVRVVTEQQHCCDPKHPSHQQCAPDQLVCRDGSVFHGRLLVWVCYATKLIHRDVRYLAFSVYNAALSGFR